MLAYHQEIGSLKAQKNFLPKIWETVFCYEGTQFNLYICFAESMCR